ncbi:hypothetical protein KUCAC02_017617 [Chaenocephalus aceratus]|uniref:Uncharacterized protein n=1 Tax=Chaenocephalus aceratus TaxID=36190 RepID=A0ACB9W2J2_CHAAC|nr:hypothetical protein KUCAC02_017617 [Chaenocephalus aceratus]
MLKQLQRGETDQTLLTFIDKAMKVEDERKKLLESHYSQELSLLYILQEDYDRANTTPTTPCSSSCGRLTTPVWIHC